MAIDPDSGTSQQQIINALGIICQELAGIRAVAEAQRAADEAAREMTERLIEEARVQDATPLTPVELLPAPDYYPFLELPLGTLVRELPTGGRLFVLPDGLIIRTAARKDVVVIGEDGELANAETGPGNSVTVAPGLVFSLAPDFLQLTHEAAGIAGLPADVQPQLTAPGRVSVQLPCGTQLNVYQQARKMTIVNPSGTIGVVGETRIEAFGEEVQTRLITNGPRTFSFLESGHAGVVELDGTVQIAMASGEDLVITFPESETANPPVPDPSICATCGIRHS